MNKNIELVYKVILGKRSRFLGESTFDEAAVYKREDQLYYGITYTAHTTTGRPVAFIAPIYDWITLENIGR